MKPPRRIRPSVAWKLYLFGDSGDTRQFRWRYILMRPYRSEFARSALPQASVQLLGVRWHQFKPRRERREDGTRIHTKWEYDIAEDVRELVCEEIRPGVYAEWADARERVSL